MSGQGGGCLLATGAYSAPKPQAPFVTTGFDDIANGCPLDPVTRHEWKSVRNTENQTLLHIAAKYGRADTTCILLRVGVSAAIVDNSGKLAEDYASVTWIKNELVRARARTYLHHFWL